MTELLQTSTFRQLLQQCIHCGLCLQACPTYLVLGTEMDGPRGRISLMRAASSSRITIEGAFQEHINLCLACRSCVTACPSGVNYGRLVETAHYTVEENRQAGLLERMLRWFALGSLLPNIGRLKQLARLIHFFQQSGFGRLIQETKLVPSILQTAEALLPPMPKSYPNYKAPALATGPRKGAVAFFHGCVQEAFLADVNTATVRVLQRNGFDVHTPKGQTCCGAAHNHLGELALAQKLARQNIDAYLDLERDVEFVAIINNAGGCGAALKEYDHLLKDDLKYSDWATAFVNQVKDISEFLAENMSVTPTSELRTRAVYADSCHLRHAQKIIDQPRELLHTIPGLELVEMKHPEHCCGSAGVYNLTHSDTADQILDLKMAGIMAIGADTIVTSNTGCYLQLLSGVRRNGGSARVAHLVELLDQSY